MTHIIDAIITIVILMQESIAISILINISIGLVGAVIDAIFSVKVLTFAAIIVIWMKAIAINS